MAMKHGENRRLFLSKDGNCEVVVSREGYHALLRVLHGQGLEVICFKIPAKEAKSITSVKRFFEVVNEYGTAVPR